jgi:hypothetical protein
MLDPILRENFAALEIFTIKGGRGNDLRCPPVLEDDGSKGRGVELEHGV